MPPMSTRTYASISAHTVAFLGLGVMGHPMAGHLARAGHRVTVFNRTASKAQAWAGEYGGGYAPTPREAAAGGEAAADDAVWHLVINQDQVGPLSVAEVPVEPAPFTNCRAHS